MADVLYEVEWELPNGRRQTRQLTAKTAKEAGDKVSADLEALRPPAAKVIDVRKVK